MQQQATKLVLLSFLQRASSLFEGRLNQFEGKSLLRQRHVVRDPAALVAAFPGVVRACVHQAKEALRTLRLRSRGSWSANLTKAFGEAVQRAIARGGSHQESVYGLINGLTSAAQSLDADDRFRVETLAGRLA